MDESARGAGWLFFAGIMVLPDRRGDQGDRRVLDLVRRRVRALDRDHRATLSAVGALLSIPAFPLWSVCIFGVDLLILYGVAAYGGHQARVP